MAKSNKPYWMREPRGKVRERLRKIKDIVKKEGKITVRRITYKLFPDTHGKELDRKYNTAIKDVVRARIRDIIPWETIKEERVREGGGPGYRGPEEYLDFILDIDDLVRMYSRDKTPAHKEKIEVWFEKSTVEDVFSRVCRKYDVKYASTRGQVTWTFKKKAAERLEDGTKILYFGDNDDEGKEIKDVFERDLEYLGADVDVIWAAVTDEQEKRYDIPARSRLDALSTDDLEEIIGRNVLDYIDEAKLNKIQRREKKDKNKIRNRLEEVLGVDP